MVTTPILEKFQKAYSENKYDVYVLEGGSRSSKTFSIIQFMILWAYQNTGKQNRVLISRKKGTWITTTVLHDFQKVLKNYGIYEYCHHNKSVGSGVITLMTTEFWFLGLDDEQKIHGLETDIFWINEAVEASFDDYAQLMQRCVGFAILDYNPSYEEHWIFDKILKRDSTFYNHSTMLDNPLIPKNAKKQILSYEPTEYNYSQGTVDKRKWQIYGLGKRASIEGLVFANGFTEIDVIPEYVKKRFGGVDFGFTNDPTAMGTVGIDGNDLYIDEGVYKTEMLSRDIIASAKEINQSNMRNMKWISESADPRMVQEIYNAGIDIHAVKKFQGSVVAGIDKMKEMRIFITKRSQNIQKEFKNYTYRQDKTGKFLNEPIDDWNHGIDFVRYVVLSEILGKNQKPNNLQQIASIL